MVIVAASEVVWDDEVAGSISWMSSSGSEMRSTSMITGDDIDDDVSVGLRLLADAGCSCGCFELRDSAGRIDIARDDPKKESILG